ncbi:Uncharacterised protein [Mycobacteroides abscessus subsp. abscessus]|nr:Uncharacterised protein [Mycobacteroides abscessus subsp. abscessus]
MVNEPVAAITRCRAAGSPMCRPCPIKLRISRKPRARGRSRSEASTIKRSVTAPAVRSANRSASTVASTSAASDTSDTSTAANSSSTAASRDSFSATTASADPTAAAAKAEGARPFSLLLRLLLLFTCRHPRPRHIEYAFCTTRQYRQRRENLEHKIDLWIFTAPDAMRTHSACTTT